jgi:hypothetical protein
MGLPILGAHNKLLIGSDDLPKPNVVTLIIHKCVLLEISGDRSVAALSLCSNLGIHVHVVYDDWHLKLKRHCERRAKAGSKTSFWGGI